MPLAGYGMHAFASRSALAEALAEAVAGVLDRAIGERGTGFLAVSGGTTPAQFFSVLATKPIDWARVVVTLVDERLVPEASPRSNAGLVHQKLLVGAAAAARFVPLYRLAQSVEEAARLAGGALGVLPWPLDAMVLGMGTDGHTASFFPDAENLDALLDAAAPQIVSAVYAPSAGETRLTLTMRPIMEAGFLALHIEGTEKRAVLDRALAGDAPKRLPIRAVFETRPVEVYWAE
jgi:6-phosphogluconolactonase